MPPTEIKKHQRKATDKGRKLEYFTIGWNIVETVVAIIAGTVAGSVSLTAFGTDSLIEVISGGALLWRMSIDHDDPRRRRRERIALRVVSSCFLALALYICIESGLRIMDRRKPDSSIAGIILACVSLIVMPYLARLKKQVGKALKSPAMRADARQSQFGFYLSGILLAGLLTNTLLGWWWTDPLCALAMVPFIAKEGFDSLTTKT